MKILGFNIGGKAHEVENVTRKVSEQLKVIEKITKREQTRVTQDIQKWRTQTIIAENIHNPQRASLYNIYRDVVLDAHLSGLMNTILIKVQASELQLLDSNNELDTEETNKLKNEWFNEYLKYFIESIFYGHSLIQICDVKNNELELKLVNRENVVPEAGIVKKDVNGYAFSGVSYRERPYYDWLIECGSTHDLGILHKATPLVLWKKGVLGAWSHYAELFGMPIRVGKTSIHNPENKSNMEAMLENMGQASWSVIGLDDEIELVQSSSTDAYEVYDQLISRANSELSKLVLNQTGTTEEKAHVGSAEVHERMLNDLITSIKNKALFNFKKQLLPKLERLGIIKQGLTPKWDNSEKLSKAEQFNIVKELLPFYIVPTGYIKEHFGVEVQEKANFNGTSSVMKDVNNLYDA